MAAAIRRLVPVTLTAVAPLIVAAAVLSGSTAPPLADDITGWHERWLIPLPGEQLKMQATVLRPPGAGPFPLAVINHGSSQSSFARAHYAMPEYPLLTQWLLDRGYVVALPLRPGHGETRGPYFEDHGRCESADYAKAGRATAGTIQAAIDHLTLQPWVRKTGVVVAGQSSGAWGALALASRNPRTVAAVINFAGGRGGRADDQPGNNCVPDRLVATAGEFGRTARIASLWLYAENDSYFAPALARRMHAAYREAGGRAEFHLLPPIGSEGHGVIGSEAAAHLWRPLLEAFLRANGPRSPRPVPAG